LNVDLILPDNTERHAATRNNLTGRENGGTDAAFGLFVVDGDIHAVRFKRPTLVVG